MSGKWFWRFIAEYGAELGGKMGLHIISDVHHEVE